MKILVTGAAGFIGGYLTEKLIENNSKVYGVFRAGEPTKYLKHKLNVRFCDVVKYNEVKDMLKKIKPDVIYHLAAQSVPTVSYEKPKETFRVNVEGAINIFEAIRKLDLDTLVLITGTSGEYGKTFADPQYQSTPPTEKAPLQPVHPYAISKVAKEMLAVNYYANYNMRTIVARVFNTIGPRKEQDLPSDIAKQIVKIEKGLQSPIIEMGNLDAKRAYTDVRDVVNALTMLAEKGEPGEIYNLCSTNVLSTKNVLELFLSKTKIKPEIKIVDKKLRPYDEPIIWGNNAKLVSKTGWAPKIPIEKTIDDILEFWRKNLETA